MTGPERLDVLAAEVAEAHDAVMALWLSCDDDDTAHALHAAMESLTRAASAARIARGRAEVTA
jgi:hypothetical protein